MKDEFLRTTLYDSENQAEDMQDFCIDAMKRKLNGETWTSIARDFNQKFNTNVSANAICSMANSAIRAQVKDNDVKNVQSMNNFEYVDLGLQSGTLWAKHNIGATCGDTPESWYGNYYAWGETLAKDNYEWATYKHCTAWNKLTKYNTQKTYGSIVDRKSTLESSDDVASVDIDIASHIPTRDQIEELMSLHSKWVTNYNGVLGLNGRVFIGSNGNTLFIPAAGYFYASSRYDVGADCGLWSSSLNLDNSNCAYFLYFNSDDVDNNDYYRYCGQNVRPVRN